MTRRADHHDTGGAHADDAQLMSALAAALDAENAAIYAYSVAGAHLDAPARRAAARSDYDVHRAQALAVTGWLTQRAAASSTPAPPAAVYSLAAPVTDPASAAELLARAEEAAAACYADVVAAATGALQRSAALALQSAAVREARWRGTSVPFPGLVGRLPPPS